MAHLLGLLNQASLYGADVIPKLGGLFKIAAAGAAGGYLLDKWRSRNKVVQPKPFRPELSNPQLYYGANIYDRARYGIDYDTWRSQTGIRKSH
jgi:hypothetical protein